MSRLVGGFSCIHIVHVWTYKQTGDSRAAFEKVKLIVERTSAVSQFEQRQRGGSMWSWIWKQPQQIVGTASGVVGIRYALHTWNIATLHICNTAIKHYTLHHTLNSTLPQEHRTRLTGIYTLYNVPQDKHMLRLSRAMRFQNTSITIKRPFQLKRHISHDVNLHPNGTRVQLTYTYKQSLTDNPEFNM